VSDAFLSEPVSASISKVAWEVPEDLAYNDGFRKYLQMAGKNLKLNLQNNLLLATEMAYSNKVVVDLTINKDGSLQSNDIVKSSGSKQIDKIVLQSVKETLTYLKIPANELSGNSVDATLIINF
jgi:TonB family protein